MGYTSLWGKIAREILIGVLDSFLEALYILRNLQFVEHQEHKLASVLTMSGAFWIATYRRVMDPAKLAAYAALAGPAITAGGGKFIARGPAAVTYEGAAAGSRVVVIHFESVKAAVDLHDSPAYQKALEALGDGVEREIRIVEGC